MGLHILTLSVSVDIIGRYPETIPVIAKKRGLAENFSYEITEFLIVGIEVSTLPMPKVPTEQLQLPYTSHTYLRFI